MKKIYKFKSVIYAFLAFTLCISCSKNDEPTKEKEEEKPTELLINNISFPVDSNTAEFINFKRRVVMFEFVTTGCSYCPYVMAATNKLMEQPEKSNDFCVIASYTKYNKGKLNNEYSSMFEKQLSDYSVPKMYFDARKNQTYSFNRKVDDLAENVIYKGFVLSLKKKYPPKVGITAKSSVENEKVKVDVGLKVGSKGKYNIQIAVVEDNVNTYQDNSEKVPGYDFRNHHHVLQYAIVNSYDGQKLKNGEDLEVFSYYAENFEFDMPANIKNIDNCKLVIYILSTDSESSTKQYVTNAVTIKLNGGVIPLEYETQQVPN